MYTRCPDCETTFRLGAEDLRRAHGKVRCGDCGHVFNALEFLAEDAEDTDDSLPVLTSGPAVISSPDNPHRDEAMFEPANETEAPETPEQPESASYELEIKAYDEKTGEAWSPLETSTWDSEQIPDVALIDDSLTSDEDSWDSNAEANPSITVEQPVWQTDAGDEDGASNSHNAINALETSQDVNLLAQDTYTSQTDESLTTANNTDYDTESELPVFYSDDSPFEAEEKAAAEEPVASTPAWQADTANEADNTDEDEQISAALDDNAYEEADETPEDDSPEFDDTIWERIPGVGAAEEQRGTQSGIEAPADADQLADGLSYTGTDFLAINPDVIAEPNYDDDDAAINPEATDSTDEAAPDSSSDNELGFNVPENKWSAFFGDEPAPAPPPISDEVAASLKDEPAYEADEDAASVEISEEAESEFAFSAEGTNEVSEEDEGVSEDNTFSEEQTEAEQKLDGTLAGPVVIEFDAPAEIDEDEHEDPQAADDLVAEMTAVFGDESEPLDSSAEATVTDDEPEADESDRDIEADFEHEVSRQSPEDSAEDDESGEESAEPHWTEMESIEEVILSTGEFGAAEIASSLAELKKESESTEPKDADGWRPEHWQPENEAQDANATGLMPAWKSAYAASGASRYGKLWLGAIIILIIGFSTQLLHYNRDKLAASPSYGEMTRNIYNKLGLDLYPNWGMDNYKIRGSKAITGESGQDVMDIRTQIAAVGKLAVGLPQLRVVLRDRWSNPVAARTFTPEEYMANEPLPADGMLQPNQAVAAHVAIVDPGSGAQGYQLELCLPRRDTGLECTGQPFK